ncbi:MAG: hypothetical protein ACRDLN_00065 [Solirubrobacteraceae bacterium]
MFLTFLLVSIPDRYFGLIFVGGVVILDLGDRLRLRRAERQRRGSSRCFEAGGAFARPLAQPISGVRVTLYKHADPDASLSYEISGTNDKPIPSGSRGDLPPESISSAPRTVVLPISAEANAALTVTLRSSTQRGCYGVLLSHTSESDAGTYEGPVAGTPTSTRAVGILATPVAAQPPARASSAR